MTTDTFTLPRHALVDGTDQATRSHSESPIGSEAPAADRPRPTKRGAGHAIRLLLSDEGRQPAPDHLMLLGPNGGPLWAAMITN